MRGVRAMQDGAGYGLVEPLFVSTERVRERSGERCRQTSRELCAMDLKDPDHVDSFKREFLDDLEDSLSTRERPGRRRERRSTSRDI